MKKSNKNHTPIFGIKKLTQAVTLGLMLVGGEVAASSNAGNTGLRNANSTNTSTDGVTYQTIGDLEIYQAAKGGSAALMMMLDMSGSMGYNLNGRANPDTQNACQGETVRFERYPFTDKDGNRINSIQSFYGGVDDLSDGIYVAMTYCSDGGRNRISELKHAIISLLADGRNLREDYKVGMGTFPAVSNYWGGRLYVPAKPLTPEHRYRIIKEVVGLNLIGSTPMMSAYAEAASYLMGTTTAPLVDVNAPERTAYIEKKRFAWDAAKNISGFGNVGGKLWSTHSCQNSAAAMEFGASFPDWYACGMAPSFFNNPINANDFKWITNQTKRYSPLLDDAFNKLQLTQMGNVDTIGFNAVESGQVVRRNIDIVDGKIPSRYTTEQIAREMSGMDSTSALQSNTFSNHASLGVSVGEKIKYKPSQTVMSMNESGFPRAATDTKTADLSRYQSPVDPNSCDGYGIYLLTDGQPNNAGIAPGLMLHALDKGAGREAERLREIAGGVQLEGTNAVDPNQWKVGGDFAKILREGVHTKNNMVIKTAGVGFGNVFAGQYDKKTVTTASGSVVEVVDCDSYTKYDPVNKADAKYFCKMTEIGAGYGDGGFLATSDAREISESIKRFAASLNQEISSQPAGTISVPKDPLSVTNIQPYAYLPMIEPKVTSNEAVWRGNLKKFHTLKGTLYGKDTTTRLYVRAGNATTENTDYPSQFNIAAMDIWQKSANQGNNALIDVGGTKENLVDIKTTKLNSRSVYLENYESFDRNRYEASNELEKIAYMKTVKKDPKLVKVSIEDGELIGIDGLKPPYNLDDKIHIVEFLGVNLSNHRPTTNSNDALKESVKKAIAAGQFNDRVLGGVVHSVPVLATYKGEFEDNGGISSDEAKRDDTLLYGSMDGALHMVEANSGQERFAFIPRAIFEDTEQRNALLVYGKNNSRVGNPVFGVDAPWTVYGDYVYEFADKDGKAKDPATVRAKHMYAFGGMRMGGNGIFGLDISKMSKAIDGDKTDREPSLMFSINRYTPGFQRMGQTWSKPLVAKIRTGRNPRDFRDVVIFGGGYDMCYEHPKFRVGADTSTHTLTNLPHQQRTTQFGQFLSQADAECKKTQALGNAVYMVDMKTGGLIASWTGETYPDMKDSVVGEITALDRNNNGAIDHLYFADLGGKVFRVDLKEGVSPVGTISGSTNTEIVNVGSSITRRLVKVLDANKDQEDNTNHIKYRFYDQPIVSFYDHAGKTFAVVNIASGDRSSPVHTHRGANSTGEIVNPNRIFGFFDRDLATTKLDRAAADPGLISKDLSVSDLVEIKPKDVDSHAAAVAKPDANGVVTGGGVNTVALGYMTRLKAAVESATKTNAEGWWYKMDRFDGLTQIPNLKSIGTGLVTGNVYYANIYSPNYEYTTGNSCTARVSGGTERQLYCLPWGVCATSEGKITTENGVLGFIKAGPGIQELALGTVTDTSGASSAFRAILGHQTLSEIAKEDNEKRRDVNGGDVNRAFSRLPSDAKPQGGSGTGADVYGQNIITSPQYTLAVQRWYDLQNEKQN